MLENVEVSEELKMILVMDTGNTNIVLGVYDDDQLKYHWRMETYRQKTEDEYAMQVKSLFSHVDLRFEDINGIIISSVVPPVMFPLEQMCKNTLSGNRSSLVLELKPG